ncbi:MAG: GEVED domain-containing protein [Chitinophagaceae bacterium]
MIKKLLPLLLFVLPLNSFAQYCFPVYSVACTSNDFIDNFSTTGGITNITNNGTGCTGPAPNNYTFFNSMNVSQIQGLSFNVSMQSGSSWSQGFRIWIDWNQDLDFDDPGEDVYVSGPASTAAFTGTITVPITAIPGPTRMRVLCRFANIPAVTDYCTTTTSFSFGECEDYVMNVIAATPCSGMPTAGNITQGNFTVCAGNTANLSLTGTSYLGNQSYQWQQSINGGATWTNVVGGVGGASPNYQTPPLNATIMYRMYVLCNSSNLADTTAPITITVSGPSYAALPYFQDFETWSSYCGNMDVPNDNHWTSNPSTGSNSWRRNSDGLTAAWLNPAQCMYFPQASKNQYSARFHSGYTTATGYMDLFLDCSNGTPNKTLVFDYINDNSTNGNADYLELLVSTNAGATFTPLGNFNSSQFWATLTMLFTSNSPTTVIRFIGHGNTFSSINNTDIGLDNINVLEDCTGTPTAGAINNLLPCANIPFDLTLSGNTLSGGLTYTWEIATSATGPWTSLGLTTDPKINTTIGTPSYFRCIVTCVQSNMSDTTAVQFIDLASFYYCYCISQANPPTTIFQNIGNVTLIDAQSNTLINNGNPLPTTNNPTSLSLYTQYGFTVPIVEIYRDSIYDLSTSSFSQTSTLASGFSAVYIDFNRDGSFSPVNEMVLSGLINTTAPTLTGNFTVPANAQYGYTGMRVVYEVGGSATTINPCGNYNNGETEDYVVNIAYSPCKTPPNAGVAIIDDTITCPGYSVFLVDTTHDLIFQNLTFNWQVSNDGIVYNDVPGATLDTLTYVVNNNTWFRFRTTCNGTSDAYSNPVKVVMSPPLACYGMSQAVGGIDDTSDIGAFIIAEASTSNNIYSYITGGPHLNNPLAIKKYTNYTNSAPMILSTDSTYKFSIYHVMNTVNHKDAKVTIFIDYNNNQQYDLPAERVFTGIADINNFYLNGYVTTPIAPAINVPTGLRVILNNDIGPNPASDNGIGLYTSGETEDYIVQFKLKQLFTGINNSAISLDHVTVYPNPTSGNVFVSFQTKELMPVQIDVLSMTGAVVYKQNVAPVFGNKVLELPLANLAKGTYIVKLTTEKGNFIKKLTVQ